MKLIKLLILSLVCAFCALAVKGQLANPTLNILTQNAGRVTLNGTVDIQVTVGNTGPNTIGTRKLRVQISVPIAYVTPAPDAQQTGLPVGWSITSNVAGSGVITICNGTDAIPNGQQRQILIKIQGTALTPVGSPQGIIGTLISTGGANQTTGSSCTVAGTINGNNTSDDGGNTSIEVIPASSCTLGVTASAGMIACNGGTTILTATPTGATGTVEYSITGGAPFQASNIFTINAAGSPYTVTAREVSTPTCAAIATPVTVNDPSALPAPTISVVQPTCTVATGTITITSATTGLTFSLDGGAYAAYPAGGYVVASGAHTLTVQNASNCISVVSNITIEAQPVIPPAPIAGTITQPTCAVSTGSVVLSDLPTGNWTINPGTITGSTATTTINGLAPGIYNFTVTNTVRCTSTASANVVINNEPGAPPAPTPGMITQPTCALSTGSVVLSGLPSGIWTINPGAITGNTATISVNSLAPGTYNFTVTDAAGCTSEISADVVINTVAGSPTAPTFSVTQPTCAITTGVITITSSTAGLAFSLDGGSFAAYPAGGYFVAPGPHILIAQNTSSCISPVTNITVNAQPATPAVPTISIVQPTCTEATGTITIGSATAGLTFSLDGGLYAAYPASGYIIGTGAHTITAQNTDRCISAIANFAVDRQPASPTASASTGIITCFGGTAALTVTAAGGSGSYQYSLNGGAFQTDNIFTISARTHNVIVKDVNSCIATAAITVTQPASISASASGTAAIPCSGGTTTLIVAASGGTAPLQYSLNGGAFQPGNAFTVSAGPQNVIVRDANLCTKTISAILVIQPVSLTGLATARRITECGGTTKVTLTASGGRTPYTGEGVFIRGPGTWSFPLTDAGGCTTTANITIEAPGCMDLKVYPNPASNSITINHSTAAAGSTIQVFEINGALVISKQVPQDAFKSIVDIRRLAAGSYILVYLNGNEKKTILFRKLISN